MIPTLDGFVRRLRWNARMVRMRIGAHRHRSTCLPEHRQPLVEVVVCSFDTLHPLRLTLSTLRRHTAYRNYRLLVIDNASTDGSAEYLRELAQRGTIELREGSRKPHARWVEERFRETDAPFVVFVDSDMVFLAPDWLSDLIEMFLGDPRTGIVSGEPRPRREGVVEPVGRELVDIAEAPCTWLFGLRTAMREHVPTDFGFAKEDPDPATGRRTVHDTGARFLRDARAGGWEHRAMPVGYRAKWHHWESMSWYERHIDDPAYLRDKSAQLHVIRRLADGMEGTGDVNPRPRSTPPSGG